MKVILRLVLGLLSLAFLSKEMPAQVGQAKENLQLSFKDLRNAPAEIVLNGKSLSLTTYPWRDFMPGTSSGTDGSPLMVVLRVATSDKQAFPSGVRMDRAWVLFGEQIWEASDFRSQVKPSQEEDGWIICSVTPVCEATIRRGPKWGPGIFVDVVLRLTDKEGQHYLIQAQKQLIQRSD
ncbi:MAG TPA: hypothetical protein VLB68_29490 [Pyrinomonadaceae bacterium]|nr:hypothetical protein [Pyrinomonadaceae bacterium]